MTTLLHVLQHALGRDEYGIQRKNGGKDYRNHYCAGEGHHSFALCRQAVAEGLMTEHPPSVISGGDFVFVVTPKGKDYIALNSPPEPKISRSKQRYREYLRSELDISFGEWLKWKQARKSEVPQ